MRVARRERARDARDVHGRARVGAARGVRVMRRRHLRRVRGVLRFGAMRFGEGRRAVQTDAGEGRR